MKVAVLEKGVAFKSSKWPFVPQLRALPKAVTGGLWRSEYVRGDFYCEGDANVRDGGDVIFEVIQEVLNAEVEQNASSTTGSDIEAIEPK